MDVISDVGSVSVKRYKEIIYMYWKINGYIFRLKNKNDEWRSPVFKELNGTFYFVLRPLKYISLHIHSCGATNAVEGLVYSAGIQNGDGTVHTHSQPQTVDAFLFGEEYLIHQTTLMDQRNVIAPEGHVTFFMTICLKNSKSLSNNISDSENTTTFSEERTDDQGLIILSRDLREFFEKQKECDVVFKVKDKEFPAHKSIIAARSPVFTCMFKHYMSERNSRIINIVDISPEAFYVLLVYLYSGQVDEFSSDIIVDLYEVACKYKLEDLRTKCRNFIMNNISTETFCEFVVLGSKHEDTDLEKCIMDYFIAHAKKIMPTVKWQNFLKENPIRANELYIKALNMTET